MCMGELFDYYSGNIPNGLRWMHRSGLEWGFMTRVLGDRLCGNMRGKP